MERPRGTERVRGRAEALPRFSPAIVGQTADGCNPPPAADCGALAPRRQASLPAASPIRLRAPSEQARRRQCVIGLRRARFAFGPGAGANRPKPLRAQRVRGVQAAPVG